MSSLILFEKAKSALIKSRRIKNSFHTWWASLLVAPGGGPGATRPRGNHSPQPNSLYRFSLSESTPNFPKNPHKTLISDRLYLDRYGLRCYDILYAVTRKEAEIEKRPFYDRYDNGAGSCRNSVVPGDHSASSPAGNGNGYSGTGPGYGDGNASHNGTGGPGAGGNLHRNDRGLEWIGKFTIMRGGNVPGGFVGQGGVGAEGTGNRGRLEAHGWRVGVG